VTYDLPISLIWIINECLKVYYCRFQVTFQRAVPKFVANLPIMFPSLENGVRTSQQSLQVRFNVWTLFVNKCSYSIIITNSIIITFSTWTMNICLQWFKHWNVLVNFVVKFWTWKHNWQPCNKLGNRTLKNDLKLTIIL
jgi:hypothetical protein